MYQRPAHRKTLTMALLASAAAACLAFGADRAAAFRGGGGFRIGGSFGGFHGGGFGGGGYSGFQQSHPQFQQNANQYQQNRFNEANSLQQNRFNEANNL